MIPKKLRILIADRNRYHALLIEREIEKRFSSSVTCVFQSGKAALDELGRNRYDIAIVDCSFTVAGETSMLSAIRQVDGRLPVVLTAPPDTPYPEIDREGNGLGILITKDSTFHIMITQLIEHYLKDGSFQKNGRSLKPRLSLRRKADMVQVTVNTLTHEINNPLMTILGTTELLLSNSDGCDPEITDKIRIIQESGRRIRSTLEHLGGLDHPSLIATAAGSLIETAPRKTSGGTGN